MCLSSPMSCMSCGVAEQQLEVCILIGEAAWSLCCYQAWQDVERHQEHACSSLAGKLSSLVKLAAWHNDMGDNESK